MKGAASTRRAKNKGLSITNPSRIAAVCIGFDIHMDEHKRLAIYGCTGSVGQSALDVVRHHPSQFKVSALAAGSNLELLTEQVREFKPSVTIIAKPNDESAVLEAQEKLQGDGIVTEFLIGETALSDVARQADYDILLGAITGAPGLPSTLEAVKRGKRIALANKESLVMAGPLLMKLCAESGAELLPVDSEHSAVWQCLRGESKGEVKRVILTASGGPFRTWPIEELNSVTREQALEHPTWKMGPKITVDSASMMNKALEVIEARWLFDLKVDQLGVLIHPQSIVHSMVEFVDHSIIAQLGPPDMKIPIQFALTYPQRVDCPASPISPVELSELTFEEVDNERFPAIGLGFEVARVGGSAGAVMNAANEVAVKSFLNGEICYLDIYKTVEGVLGQHDVVAAPSMEDVLHADAWARNEASVKVSAIKT